MINERMELMAFDKIILKNLLKNFNSVPFTVQFWDDEIFTIGEGAPVFKVFIREPINQKDLLTSTSLALGEAYMDKKIEIEGDLYTALDAILKHIDHFTTDFKALPKLFHNSTAKAKQKEEVSSHYDIGNDFYKLWLDDTLCYSCAYFKHEDESLHQAQLNKIDHLLAKLQLKEGESLLDIGCCWGCLLITAAKKYKVKGVGITLSQEQSDEFSKRIKNEQLEDYLTVKLMDYRDLEHSNLQFDKVVSVGMLEHVGRTNYDLFLKNVNAVLKPEGIFVLHYISGVKEGEGDAWIRKYIFPGGTIPSLREIISLSADYNFHVIDVENLRPHYRMTLLHWYKNFEDHIDEISKKFDERFIRMWRMYLCSCAASFNNGVIDLHQIVFTKGVNNHLPLTRDYLYEK